MGVLGKCEREPLENEVKLPVKGFLKKYRLGSISNAMGDCIWDSYFKAIRKGFDFFIISKDEYELVNKVTALNNKGRELEKEGKIEEAIKCYEENMRLGYPVVWSYKRLLSLYRKGKNYENEKRICLLIISMHEKENERRLQYILSHEENKGLEDRIINAHNNNIPLSVTGRLWCVYIPYEVYKYKKRLSKINKYLLKDRM